MDGDSVSYIHTKKGRADPNPVWTVDLGTNREVALIEIENRFCGDTSDTSNCLGRLSYAKVELLDSQDNVVDSKSFGDTTGIFTPFLNFNKCQTTSPSASPSTSPTNAPTLDQLYDVNPPNCTNESELEGIAIFSGKADDGNGTGIATLTLIDGAENLDLTVVAFTNGNRSVSLFLYLAVPIKHLGLLINPKIFCHDATLGDI